ncbi:FCD domain-containing protein [Nonomuraea wenchangensis]|uniref:FadR/GntR family transcriptional regulator n=1 Tax=Nonomuraea wenchangensis TaxID=568860 RepID=UPI003418816B
MAELIGGSLRKQIVRGELKEGDALPSEAALMEQFGVSRPTLREAFRVLESEALITIRRGARGGARVKTPDSAIAARHAGLVLEHRGTQLRDVYRARTEIESACARMAAQNRTKSALQRLESLYDRISDTTDVVERIRLHAEFDAAVVEASRNQTMMVMSGMLRTILDKATLESVLETAEKPSSRKAYEDAHKAHRRLIDLIEAQDAEQAERHWRRHLALAEKFVMSTGVSGRSVLDLL